MITKYRNRASLYAVIAILLSVGAALLLHKISHTRVGERGGVLIASFVVGYIAQWIFWVFVGFSLARAKGYSRDFTGTLFLVVYFIGLCLPVIVFAFPLFILFGMEDKARDGKRRR